MAPKSKKVPSKKTKTSTRKKTVSKKLQAKKKQIKSTLKRDLLLGSLLVLAMAFLYFGYLMGKNEHLSNPHKDIKTDDTIINKYLHELKKKKEKEVKKEETKTVGTQKEAEKKTVKKTVKKKILKQKEVKQKEIEKILLAPKSGKPKLVIVIDDVSTSLQLNRIKAIDMKITPSIFPPSKLNMKSNLLANDIEHYMIHLPMESGNKQFNKQFKTLRRDASIQDIHKRVQEIRKLFPNAKYLNNHTGSLFTSDYAKMKVLYNLLRQEGFVFIDSRTSSETKVKKITHDVGDAYVARDIFIDNELKVPYMHTQLKKAVRIAKKKGYALAIGHPHKATMKALKSAKHILKDVELVYIDGIYKRKSH